MSRLYLPDTNAWSHYFNGRFPSLAQRFVKEFERLHLSSIVLAELNYGASKSGVPRHRARVADLSALCPMEAFTGADAVVYGHLRTALEKKGQLIGSYDMLIAAQALRLGATVITNNVGEFSRVPSLKWQDWTK
jgi:tRNA(fMet)-specific endonuclease VapC